MKGTPMIDSELLAYARTTLAIAEGNALYQPQHLARFVADMLDDLPVTEEALLAMGFEPFHSAEYDAAYRHGELVGFIYIENNRSVTWRYTYDMANCETIGQLRCLLRGLGVMT